LNYWFILNSPILEGQVIEREFLHLGGVDLLQEAGLFRAVSHGLCAICPSDRYGGTGGSGEKGEILGDDRVGSQIITQPINLFSANTA